VLAIVILLGEATQQSVSADHLPAALALVTVSMVHKPWYLAVFYGAVRPEKEEHVAVGYVTSSIWYVGH